MSPVARIFYQMKIQYLLWAFALLCFCSCRNPAQKHYKELLQEWVGKKVYFPDNLVFTVEGKDTVDFSIAGNYKILVYADSSGCISCKLRLNDWKTWMQSKRMDSVCFLFIFSPEKRKDIINALEITDFVYPVCIDEEQRLNGLNHFPAEFGGQTFLLDKDNRVLAVGNPVYNSKVKELYLKIIRGETGNQESETLQALTTVDVDRTEVNMGRFDWHGEQKAEFTLTNTGDSPLVIYSVDTSCGCTRVEYDLQPVRPGEKRFIRVFYKADAPGHFHKSVRVQCNTEASSLQLAIRGEGVTAL
jgi:hypothetical protein